MKRIKDLNATSKRLISKIFSIFIIFTILASTHAFAEEPDKVGAQPAYDLAGSGVLNILFLGIDRTEERDKTLGVYRTDTIMLASIDLQNKKMKILSIPRDTYTYIPLTGRNDKVNHAYVWGGMGEKGIKSTINTVNQFIKYASVDYYVAMDMEPVPDIIDALGGVEVDVDIDLEVGGVNLPRGMQVLNGQQAYKYIRDRHTGNGDIDRVKRQQKFLRAAFKKLKEPYQLINIVRLKLNNEKYIKTNLGIKEMISIAAVFKGIPEENIEFYMVPGTSGYKNGGWYWFADQGKTDILLKEMFAR